MNKASLRKRFTSLVLAAVMIAGVLPASSITALALSQNPLEEATVPIDEVIAKNNGEKEFIVNLDNSMSDGGDIIYSERTKPSTSGHNRGLGMYLGQVDPTNPKNEGAGSFAFCYDHTKEASGKAEGMKVTVNESHKESDPLSVLIYYNGFTDASKNAAYVKNTLFDVMNRVWDYEYTRTNSTEWQKPEWFTSGWQDKLSDGDWRRATQLALWMSQKVMVNGASTSMLYIENQIAVDPNTGLNAGCWDESAPPYDAVWFTTANESAALNTGIDRRRVAYAAMALYWYASYQLYRGVDYTQRTPTSQFKLFDRQLLDNNFFTPSTNIIDFSSAKPDGSGTIIDAYRTLQLNTQPGEDITGIYDAGDHYIIYMMFASDTQCVDGATISIDIENSSEGIGATDGPYIMPLEKEDVMRFEKMQSLWTNDYVTTSPSGTLVLADAVGITQSSNHIGFITDATSKYLNTETLDVVTRQFATYRKLVVPKAWAEKQAADGKAVEIKLNGEFNHMLIYNMYIGNNSVDYYQPFIIGGNWTDKTEPVTVKWGGQQNPWARFSIHKVKSVNGTTSNFPGISFTATCSAYPALSICRGSKFFIDEWSNSSWQKKILCSCMGKCTRSQGYMSMTTELPKKHHSP